MKFSKTLRGYSPREVDLYLDTLKNKYNEIFAEQRQRVDELSDENAELRANLEDYKSKEKSIVDSIVESQKVAASVKSEADKYAEVISLRAKEFYAAWQNYSKTLVSSLSDAEVAQFNEILAKMESLVNDFDGGDVRQFSAATAADVNLTSQTSVDSQDDVVQSKAEQKFASKMINPIKKVEDAAGERHHAIELEELLVPKESLDDLCRSLGVKPEEEK